MKMICAVGALVVGAGLFSASATAGPVGRAPLSADQLFTRAATYVCTRDDRGWHYMRGERRVTCRPVRPRGAFWGWRCEGPRCGWWRRQNRHWHDAG